NLPDPRPILSSMNLDPSRSLKVHVDAATSAPYTLESSQDLIHWTPVATNLYGGAFDYQDSAVASVPNRFYRAALVPPPAVSNPQVTFAGTAPGGGSLLRVDNATGPYIVQTATNLF